MVFSHKPRTKQLKKHMFNLELVRILRVLQNLYFV
jgi:hypothetical protein